MCICESGGVAVLSLLFSVPGLFCMLVAILLINLLIIILKWAPKNPAQRGAVQLRQKINLNSEDWVRIARKYTAARTINGDTKNKEFGRTAYKSEALSTRINMNNKGRAHSETEAVRPLGRVGAQLYKKLLITKYYLSAVARTKPE